jgi:hypothetical protein
MILPHVKEKLIWVLSFLPFHLLNFHVVVWSVFWSRWPWSYLTCICSPQWKESFYNCCRKIRKETIMKKFSINLPRRNTLYVLFTTVCETLYLKFSFNTCKTKREYCHHFWRWKHW